MSPSCWRHGGRDLVFKFWCWLLLVCGALACSGSTQTRLDALESRSSRNAEELDTVARAASRLTAIWTPVTEAYERAALRYEKATARYRVVEANTRRSSTAYVAAAENWKDARRGWELYRRLILVAAALDVRNLDNYRGWRRSGPAEKFSCASVSTSAFRRFLTGQGVALAGLDVDHIVPRSMGGADHPMNYQLLDSSTNRSLGARWDRGKCLMAADRCAGAMAVSRKCGGYEGPWFR